MLASLACLVAESTLPSAVTSMVPLISCDLLAWLQEIWFSGSSIGRLQIGGVLFHVGDFCSRAWRVAAGPRYSDDFPRRQYREHHDVIICGASEHVLPLESLACAVDFDLPVLPFTAEFSSLAVPSLVPAGWL